MTIDEQLIETVKQYNEGAITATEMLNKIFQVIGDESKEFWDQFNLQENSDLEIEPIESHQEQTERAMRGELTKND